VSATGESENTSRGNKIDRNFGAEDTHDQRVECSTPGEANISRQKTRPSSTSSSCSVPHRRRGRLCVRTSHVDQPVVVDYICVGAVTRRLGGISRRRNDRNSNAATIIIIIMCRVFATRVRSTRGEEKTLEKIP